MLRPSPLVVALSVLGPFAAAAPGSVHVGPGGPIPDAKDLKGPPGTIVSEVLVPAGLAIESLSVTVLGLQHSWCGDVSAVILHVPSGIQQTLVFRIGLPAVPPPNIFGDSSNYGGNYVFASGAASNIWFAAAGGGTTFVIPPATYDPSAAGSGTAVPLDALFAGVNAQGTWRLTLSDWAAGDTGSFVGWELEVEGGPPGACPSPGSCFAPHEGTGCADAACCADVCDDDPACCDRGWDALCVDVALTLCTGCGEPAAGNCCAAHAGTGCADGPCCEQVCTADLTCCTLGWDADCAAAAAALPLCNCPEPCVGNDCCFSPHASPGCKEPTCCSAVCAVKPECCFATWDFACAVAAFQVCCPADLDGNGVVDGADLGELLGVIYDPSGADGPADFDCSGAVDAGDLGLILASWGSC